jgi:hypothetical protein
MGFNSRLKGLSLFSHTFRLHHQHRPQSEVKGKGKAISLQAWTSPEVSRNLRLPDFKTIGT